MARGVTSAVDVGPLPESLVAYTLMVYCVPFVRLGTIRVVAGSVDEYPPGLAVTV
jgi:hypothetical protein